MKGEIFPAGWNEKRVSRVLLYYEKQTEVEAVAQDEAAFEERGETVVEVPYDLMPQVRQILAQYKGGKKEE